MADFNDVINALKENNVKEDSRDKRRLNQATAHSQRNNQGLQELSQIILDSGSAKEKENVSEVKTPVVNKGAEEEAQKDQLNEQKKDRSILKKIAGGIGGLVDFAKDKAKAAGKSFMDILKGTLFAGLFFAIAKFFQSPMFGELVDVITNVLLPKLIVVGKFLKENVVKFFGDLFRFVQDPTWENFKKFDIMSVVTTLGAITLLLAPKLLLGGLFGAVKLFGKGIRGGLGFLERQGMELEKDIKKNKGRGRKVRKGFFNKIFGGITDLAKNVGGGAKNAVKKTGGKVLEGGKKLGGRAANIGKGLLKGAKFLPGVGLAVTGIMGIFDGVTAGFEEYNKGGSAGDVAREAAAGVVSGLTFGLVSQETISGAFTTIGDKFKTGFDKMKEDTLAGVDKLKDLGVSAKEKLKDVAGGLKEKFDNVSEKVSGFFGDIKGKFTALTDKLPSIKDVGSKIGNFFGFGKKEEKEMAAPLVQFQKERTRLVDRIAMLEKKIADAPIKRGIKARANRNKLQMREEQLRKLDQSAIAKSMGGDASAPAIVNAPTIKTNNNTSNQNISTSSSASNQDQTISYATSGF